MGKIIATAIMPHPPILLSAIGKGKEQKAIKTLNGIRELADIINGLNPDTIIIISPHGPVFRDACSITVEEELYGDFERFGHKELSQTYINDTELAKEIVKVTESENLPLVPLKFDNPYGATVALDWGILVPMYFISGENGKKILNMKKDFRILPMAYGIMKGEELRQMGRAVRKAVENSDKNVLILASGDLSHKLSTTNSNYAFDSMGPVFEEKIEDVVKRADIDGIINFDKKISDPAAECGLRSFQIMAGAVDNKKIEPKVFSHEAPYGVGYMTAYWDIS